METGEIIDGERLTALQMERNEKIENVACWVKNLEADAAAYKAEMDAFTARKKQAEQKAERLKAWLAEATGGQKLNLTRADIRFIKSERVEILNEGKLPKKYLVKKITFSPDKKLIKDLLKAGKNVSGCALKEYQNIQIK